MFKIFRSPRKSTVNVPFILMVLLSGMMAYSRPGRITIDLFCLFMITIVLDTLHFFWMSKNIEIALMPTLNKIQKRKQLDIGVEIKNNSLWPIPRLYIEALDGYRLSLKEKQNYCLFLGGRGVKEIIFTYEAKLSGMQLVGLKYAFLQDYLGLYKKDLPLPHYEKVKVLPDIREDMLLDEFFNQETEEGYRRGQNHQEIKEVVSEDLVAYKEGDSPKLIHWKIFAQKDELLVRQRETKEQKGEKVILILNPIGSVREEAERYELQDKSVTISLSLCNGLITEGYEVGFMYYKEGSWMKVSLKSKRELQYLREKLGNYETIISEEDRAYRRVLKRFLNDMYLEPSFKLVVTEQIDEKFIYYLEEAHKISNNIQFICMKEPIKEFKKAEIKVWKVTEGYRLKDDGKED